MRLYFGGAEIGTHRKILAERGVTNVAMSYMGLRRRVNFTRPWLIEEKFPESMSVFLDSGAYTINHEDKYDEAELAEISDHYQDFVVKNLDRVDLVTEFDALPLGRDWIEEMREDFYNDLPREKFMPIWHPVWGLEYLQEMASFYEVIGIPTTSMEGRNLRPVLNALAANGTRIHGIAMTKTEEMLSIRWDSVASTSWISPQRFGDTIVWTGNELKRYPKKYKGVARKRHRTLFNEHGFDAQAIADDDSTEVLNLSVWSFQEFEKYVNRRQKNGPVTDVFSHREPEKVEEAPDVVDDPPEDDVQSPSTPETSRAVVKHREATHVLPVMGIFTEKNEDDEDKPPVITIRSESARICDSCFLAQKCPMYESGANCAYNIPVTLRTREQRKALHEGLLEMQTQRVMFMRMAEEMEGGYADPNLTKELNLLNKMMADYAELEKEGFSITMRAHGVASGEQAQSGVFSRLFGREAGQQVQQIEAGPVSADEIIDAEYVEEVED